MASRAPIDQTLLADLVERRLEAPEVEYKNFMPLTGGVERANIARHMCALANSGGGWLVFGFEDDGSAAEPHPGDLSAYGQDAINGIGAKYLQPQPHCEVHVVAASSGLEYPVVRVLSHGAVPVCAKASGPQDDKGRPRGIVKGVHYVRAPGPMSTPIDSPELWREVLRRCVLADRTSLLSSIGQLFDRPQPVEAQASPLRRLMDVALERWASGVDGADWPVDAAANRIAFGFRLTTDAGDAPTALPLAELDRALQEPPPLRRASAAAARVPSCAATPARVGPA